LEKISIIIAVHKIEIPYFLEELVLDSIESFLSCDKWVDVLYQLIDLIDNTESHDIGSFDFRAVPRWFFLFLDLSAGFEKVDGVNESGSGEDGEWFLLDYVLVFF
jgi:hypothetical protein